MKDSLLLQKFRMVSVDRPGFGYSDYGQPQHLDVQSIWMQQAFLSTRQSYSPHPAGHSLEARW